MWYEREICLTFLGLLVHFHFLPLWRYTEKLRSQSISGSLKTVFFMSSVCVCSVVSKVSFLWSFILNTASSDRQNCHMSLSHSDATWVYRQLFSTHSSQKTLSFCEKSLYVKYSCSLWSVYVCVCVCVCMPADEIQPYTFETSWCVRVCASRWNAICYKVKQTS